MSSQRGMYEIVCGSYSTNTCFRKIRTPDMRGNNTTHEFTKAVLEKMEAEEKRQAAA